MYASGKRVVNVLFDGLNTNKMNWFSLQNVIYSDWTDFPSVLKETCGHGCYVTIDGFGGYVTYTF